MNLVYLITTQEECLDFDTLEQAWERVQQLIRQGVDADEISLSRIDLDEKPVISDEEFLALFV